MKLIIYTIALFLMDPGIILYDFNPESRFRQWQVVDDVVMGGRSGGGFSLSDEGHGLFSGYVSLENNGGFSSVRHQMESVSVRDHERFVIRLKGDGKRYQFRARSRISGRHAYAAYFQTTGEWQEVEIPFSEMFPTFRGMKLPMPNFGGRQVEEIGFLIANKKAEQFRLEIDYIRVE